MFLNIHYKVSIKQKVSENDIKVETEQTAMKHIYKTYKPRGTVRRTKFTEREKELKRFDSERAKEKLDKKVAVNRIYRTQT